jgi:hypothetical protein
MRLEQIIAFGVIGSAGFGFLGALILRRFFVPLAIVAPLALLIYVHWRDVLRTYQLYNEIGQIDGKAVAFLSIQYVVVALAVWFGGLIAFVVRLFTQDTSRGAIDDGRR